MSLPPLNTYSIWLTFDPESEKDLGRTINELSKRFRAEPFQPHSTLASASELDKNELITAVRKLSDQIRVFNLMIGKIRCGEDPFQKVTVDLEYTEELLEVHRTADELLGGEYSKREYPHISLLYETMSCGELHGRLKLAEMDVPAQVKGTGLSLVHCKGSPNSWETVFSVNL